MKITSIDPGKVFYKEPKGWTFMLVVNGSVQPVGDRYHSSANEAKQAMREHVAWLRKHHDITA